MLLLSKTKMAKLVTGKVLFSYVHVFEKYSMNEGEEGKYSVNILIPKKDKRQIARIEKAIEKAIEEGKSKWGGKVPAKFKLPLRDGDEEKPEDEVYEGMMFFVANSKRKPGIVDAELNPIIDEEEFYSGCWGRASVNFYAFNVSGNKGVAAGLNNLQKLEDGERLSGGTTPEEDFGDEDLY